MSTTSSRRLAFGLAGVLVLLAGMVLGGVVDGPGRRGRSTSPASTEQETPGTSVSAAADGDPESSGPQGAQTEEGAVAVAMALAAAPQAWLYLSDEELVTRVRAVAAASAVDRLTAEITGEVSVARDALARSQGRIWWVVRPLAWRLDSFSASRAQISVWTVSVLSAADVAMPQSDWVTTTFDLSWENGAWRLAANRDTPGPTPQLGGRDTAWEPEPFDDALAGFQRVGAEVPS